MRVDTTYPIRKSSKKNYGIPLDPSRKTNDNTGTIKEKIVSFSDSYVAEENNDRISAMSEYDLRDREKNL